MPPSVLPQPENVASSGTHTHLAYLTAGQRSAVKGLQRAVEALTPLVVLFGETGSGKTTVIDAFRAAPSSRDVVVVHVSSTGGADVPGPATFDDLLTAICRRLASGEPPQQRPAIVAMLAPCLRSLIEAGTVVVVVIDNADHLADDVIAGMVRLHDYLDVAASHLIRVFLGSLDLASRIDALMNTMTGEEPLTEIRLSPPKADEVSAIIAYEHGARHDGPVLTPGAIERISAYAKSNLHWALPMADAACALAEREGVQEVTPEVVREVLLDIWTPGDQRAADPSADETPPPVPDGAFLVPARNIPSGLFDALNQAPDLDASFYDDLSAHHQATPRARGQSYRVVFLRVGALFAVLSLAAAAVWVTQKSPDVDSPTNRSVAIEANPQPTANPSQPRLADVPEDAAPTAPSGAEAEPPRTDATSDRPPVPPTEASPVDSADTKGKAANGPVTGNKTTAPRIVKPAPPPQRPDDLKSDTWIQTR